MVSACCGAVGQWFHLLSARLCLCSQLDTGFSRGSGLYLAVRVSSFGTSSQLHAVYACCYLACATALAQVPEHCVPLCATLCKPCVCCALPVSCAFCTVAGLGQADTYCILSMHASVYHCMALVMVKSYAVAVLWAYQQGVCCFDTGHCIAMQCVLFKGVAYVRPCGVSGSTLADVSHVTVQCHSTRYCWVCTQRIPHLTMAMHVPCGSHVHVSQGGYVVLPFREPVWSVFNGLGSSAVLLLGSDSWACGVKYDRRPYMQPICACLSSRLLLILYVAY